MLTMTTFMAMMLTQCSAMETKPSSSKQLNLGKLLTTKIKEVLMKQRVTEEIRKRLQVVQEVEELYKMEKVDEDAGEHAFAIRKNNMDEDAIKKAIEKVFPLKKKKMDG